MGKDLVDSFELVKKRFQQADELLGRELSAIMFSGPKEVLTETQNTQPALFTMEAAITDILNENSIVPSYTAGHSLGEYSALYAAGVLSFEDGVVTVAKRGALMAEAGKKVEGTMAAIIGLDKETIAEVLDGVSGTVVPANENAPGQIVISGDVPAVKEACEKLKAAGAKRALPLPVSGAFHSPLMKDAADEFQSVLQSLQFQQPQCPVICNVTGKAENDPQKIKELLIQQLMSPVRWVMTMDTLASVDSGTFLEVGPGNILRGLAKKCNNELNVVPCDSGTNIYSLLNGK